MRQMVFKLPVFSDVGGRRRDSDRAPYVPEEAGNLGCQFRHSLNRRNKFMWRFLEIAIESIKTEITDSAHRASLEQTIIAGAKLAQTLTPPTTILGRVAAAILTVAADLGL